MSKFSALKDLNLVLRGEVTIKGYTFPIKTANLDEQIKSIKFDETKFKKKQRILSQEEIENLTTLDKRLVNGKSSVLVIEYDLTDPEYLKYAEEVLKIRENIIFIKYIDMDMEIDEKVTLWKAWGVGKGDWLGVYNFLVSKGFDRFDLDMLRLKITEVLAPKEVFEEAKKEVELEVPKSKKKKELEKEETVLIS